MSNKPGNSFLDDVWDSAKKPFRAKKEKVKKAGKNDQNYMLITDHDPQRSLKRSSMLQCGHKRSHHYKLL